MNMQPSANQTHRQTHTGHTDTYKPQQQEDVDIWWREEGVDRNNHALLIIPWETKIIYLMTCYRHKYSVYVFIVACACPRYAPFCYAKKTLQLAYTHSFGVVYEGVGLVVAETDVDQVLHPIFPLLPSVALEKSQERFTLT